MRPAYLTNHAAALGGGGTITMTSPLMRACTRLPVQTCHRRGAHAIGGMAAFIPSRRDPAVDEAAPAKGRGGQHPRGW
ncbi:hypothetical protein [Streptomyces hygroscopicus]|uniref:hypothetical protein n=1 Tax=Streptomyces hygroscopicus TaxID=1912 RepID=UPI003F4CF2F1